MWGIIHRRYLQAAQSYTDIRGTWLPPLPHIPSPQCREARLNLEPVLSPARGKVCWWCEDTCHLCTELPTTLMQKRPRSVTHVQVVATWLPFLGSRGASLRLPSPLSPRRSHLDSAVVRSGTDVRWRHLPHDTLTSEVANNRSAPCCSQGLGQAAGDRPSQGRGAEPTWARRRSLSSAGFGALFHMGFSEQINASQYLLATYSYFKNLSGH